MEEIVRLTERDGVNPAVDYINHISSDDTWRVTIKGKEVGRPIITHEGVERIARVYGVTISEYEWHKTHIDDMMLMVEVTGFWEDGRRTPEVGESSDRNAGAIGKNYPHSMAWKRGYDRAVLKHLGIEAYSAEEADDFKGGARQYGQGPKKRTTQKSTKQLKQKAACSKQSETDKDEVPISDQIKRALVKTTEYLNKQGVSVKLEDVIKEHTGKSTLDELTQDEGKQLIPKLNQMFNKRD